MPKRARFFFRFCPTDCTFARIQTQWLALRWIRSGWCRDNDLDLEFHYCIMPIVGAVHATTLAPNWHKANVTRRSESFTSHAVMPSDYSRKMQQMVIK